MLITEFIFLKNLAIRNNADRIAPNNYANLMNRSSFMNMDHLEVSNNIILNPKPVRLHMPEPDEALNLSSR